MQCGTAWHRQVAPIVRHHMPLKLHDVSLVASDFGLSVASGKAKCQTPQAKK